MGEVLEHADHGGIIVSQDVQLQQVVVDGMVIKMGGDRGCGGVVGRMLYRGKGVDLLPQREDDDPARVLAGGPLHAHTALDDPVDLTAPLGPPSFVIVVSDIAVGRLIRQGTHSPRPEGLALPEDHLRVIVCLTLILAGKVQIDIRLLVPLKA